MRTVPLLIALVLFMALPGVALARDAAALRACMAANLPGRSFEQDIELLQSGPDGAMQRLAGTWYWQRGNDRQSGMLQLSSPADLAGAAYLFISRNHQENIYMYMPAVGRVRHVVGATMAQSLFGSGLSAFDLKFLLSGLHGGKLTRVGVTTDNGRPAESWRYIPPVDPDILYDRLDMTVDDAWCLPVKVELYGGVPWKTLELDATSIHKENGRWTASRATLTDLRQQTTTKIQTRHDVIDANLPDQIFNPSQFYRAR
ncbi:MAG: outer membrane lipoprotein-sorting protein [Stenotrophobium sp.]